MKLLTDQVVTLDGELVEYHSELADKDYFSNSQFQDFERCEAMALAKIKGDYKPEFKEVFLEGHYFEICLNEAVFCDLTPDEYRHFEAVEEELNSNLIKYKKVLDELNNPSEYIDELKNRMVEMEDLLRNLADENDKTVEYLRDKYTQSKTKKSTVEHLQEAYDLITSIDNLYYHYDVAHDRLADENLLEYIKYNIGYTKELLKYVKQSKEAGKQYIDEKREFQLRNIEHMFKKASVNAYYNDGLIPTHDDLFANFKRVENHAQFMAKQTFIKDIIKDCKQQLVLLFDINGVPFKAKMDLFNPDTLFIGDLKYVGRLDRTWSDHYGKMVDWFVAYNYHHQMAIYTYGVSKIFGDIGENSLFAISKEDIPNIKTASFYTIDLEQEINYIADRVVRFQDIKQGKIKPTRCEECDYCKLTKKINKLDKVMITY